MLPGENNETKSKDAIASVEPITLQEDEQPSRCLNSVHQYNCSESA